MLVIDVVTSTVSTHYFLPFGPGLGFTIPAATGPNGEFITKYKGYSIYKKYLPPNVQFSVRDGEGVIHKGPESRSATDQELLDYEKRFIDNLPQ